MSADLRELDPRLAPVALRFVEWLQRGGVQVTVTSTVRSRAKQRALYERYLRGESPLPALPPGQSLHEIGLAWDMVVRPAHLQPAVGHAWARAGGQWTPRDPVHFQAKQFACRGC